MAVDRKLLQQALQQGQDISRRATAGKGFDPRGGFGVAALQIATAGLGAFAQNRAKKALAEDTLSRTTAFESKFPQFAGLNLTPESQQALALKSAGAQIDQQFKTPEGAQSPIGKIQADIQAGFLPEGTPLRKPEQSKFSVQKTDQGLIRVNPQTGESFPITSGEGERLGVPKPKDDAGKKPLSAETAKVLTVATGGINALNDLNLLLGDDGTVSLRSELAPERLKTPKGRKITLLRKDLADSIGRLRSGGAINEEELKTFNSFIPSRTDDAETTQFKMRKLGEKFQTLQAGMTGQEIPQAELKLGTQPDQNAIQAELKRRGLI